MHEASYKPSYTTALLGNVRVQKCSSQSRSLISNFRLNGFRNQHFLINRNSFWSDGCFNQLELAWGGE